VTGAVGAELDPDDARFLVDEKLAPLGLIAGPQAAAAARQREQERADQPKPGDDLLALTWKAKVISERASHAITAIFQPLFLGPVVALFAAGFVALLGWLFFVHGIAQPVRAILYAPALLVMVFAVVIVATIFHEIGHATACRYGGAEPGVMGIGLYVIWPVFYTDVTSAYGLDRRGRLRTDLGGVYFNAIFALGCGATYALTGWEPILVLVMVQTFAILQQLLPLGRLDGYLILTDLTGVPDLLGRMKPILRSALPWRAPADEVRDLKPWVRRVATGYIVLLIPVLALILVMMALHAPRVFATAYDSLGVRWEHVTAAFNAGRVGTGLGDGFQCLALVLPALGIVVSSGRVGKRAGTGALRWSDGSIARRTMVLAATAAIVGFAAYSWWPNGDYRPIQPGERGTVQGGLQNVSAVASGRPLLTPERVQQLGGAPFEKDRPSSKGGTTQRDGGANQRGQDAQQTDTTTAPTTGTGTTTTGSSAPSPTGPAPTDTSGTAAPGSTDTTTSPTPTDTSTTPADTTTSPTPTDTSTSTTPTTTQTTTTTTPTTTTTTP
jgi:putative peptide zinc metalloprotease protein